MLTARVRAARAWGLVAAALALGGAGCPPPAEDPLCTEMIKCMYGDEDGKAIIEGARTQEKYRGLVEGESEIRAAYGPGGTCWRRKDVDGDRLREVCHHECLCALGAACLDRDFRAELCERDVTKCDEFDAKTGKFDENLANYVAGPGDTFTCNEGEEGEFSVPGGTCCHHPEIAPTLARTVGDGEFLPGCANIGARDRCERYPDNEADFCSREGRDREGDAITDVEDERFEENYAHCQCTFSRQFAETEPVESCTLDVPPPPPADDEEPEEE